MVSAPVPPSRASFPRPPYKRSSPAKPKSRFAPWLPCEGVVSGRADEIFDTGENITRRITARSGASGQINRNRVCRTRIVSRVITGTPIKAIGACPAGEVSLPSRPPKLSLESPPVRLSLPAEPVHLWGQSHDRRSHSEVPLSLPSGVAPSATDEDVCRLTASPLHRQRCEPSRAAEVIPRAHHRS